MSSKSTTPTDDERNGIDEKTRESLEYCAEHSDDEVIRAVSEMLLQSSEEGSAE